jgi:hypothetical protein
MADSAEGRAFLRRVREEAEGKPYVVTETEGGFDLATDFSAEWFGLFNKAGMRRAFTHRVTLPEPGVFVVTDVSRRVDWVAGVPRLAGSVQVFSGRTKEWTFERVWAFDEHGRFTKVADYRFSSEEGRGLIEGVAEELGLEQRLPWQAKVGVAAALVSLGGLLIGGLVTLYLWQFTDYFG